MTPRARAARAAVAGTAVAVLLGLAAVAASPLMASGDTGAARGPGSVDADQGTVTRDGRAMTWRLSYRLPDPVTPPGGSGTTATTPAPPAAPGAPVPCLRQLERSR